MMLTNLCIPALVLLPELQVHAPIPRPCANRCRTLEAFTVSPRIFSAQGLSIHQKQEGAKLLNTPQMSGSTV
jgi:hypothetical protein